MQTTLTIQRMQYETIRKERCKKYSLACLWMIWKCIRRVIKPWKTLTRWFYRQVMTQVHVMELLNVLKSFLKEERLWKVKVCKCLMKEWRHDPDENEIYKFLGVKQASRIKMKEVHNRVKEEIGRRVNIVARTKLIDKNLVKAINTTAIPEQLIQWMFVNSLNLSLQNYTKSSKEILRKNNLLVRQASGDDVMNDCMWKEGRRALKSLREVYEETRLCVGCYIFVWDKRWIKEAWK